MICTIVHDPYFPKNPRSQKNNCFVNITSFPNNLSQSNHFLQWLCKVVSEEDTMITGTTKKLKLTMHAFTINLGIYHFALNGLKWSKTLSLFDAVPF